MYVGMRVLIEGLKARPDLNGMVGEAESFEVGKGRYGVKLPSGEKIALKSGNLSLAPDDEAEGAAMTPEDEGLELLDCARYGEEPEVRELLAKGVPAGFTNADGTTALHFASANGHASIVQLLANAGCPHPCC